MAIIDSVKLPDNSTYEVADNHSGYQTETLTTPLTINGTQETTVEGALGGLNDYGDALADNLAANEESGAKNQNVYPYKDTTKTENGVTFTDNGDGTITVSAVSYPYTVPSDTMFVCSYFMDNEFKAGTWTLNGSPVVSDDVYINYVVHYGGEYLNYLDKGQGVTFTQAVDTEDAALVIILKSGYVLADALLFTPMLRDARIIDPTFAPHAETNKQLTSGKAERADLATINITGSTNNTGSQINTGTLFYLNGTLCKALTNIGVNDAFTLNTNYKEDTVASELTTVETWSIAPDNYAYSTDVFEFHRVGKVVYFKGCNLSDILPVGSSTIIASLPAKLIPITTWAMRGMLDPLNPSDHYAINISSNGSVEAYRYTANSANTVGAFSQSGSYIANN